MGYGKLGLLAGGFLLGTYGTRLIGSQDAKKLYTQCTAAAIRMKDEVVKDFTVIGENCGDIAAAAKDINEKRAQAREAQMIQDAKDLLASVAEKEAAAE